MTTPYPCRVPSCGHVDCISDRPTATRCHACQRPIDRRDFVVAGTSYRSPRAFHPGCAPPGGVRVCIVSPRASAPAPSRVAHPHAAR